MIHSRRHRPSDPLSAAALSFVFPGGGEAYNGRWAFASLLALSVLLVGVLGTIGGLGRVVLEAPTYGMP